MSAECESSEGPVLLNAFDSDVDKMLDLHKQGKDIIVDVHNGYCKHYQPEEGPLLIQVSAGKTGRLVIHE